MRNWLRKVMTGRYGVDEFNRFLNTTALITLVLSVLFNRYRIHLLYRNSVT